MSVTIDPRRHDAVLLRLDDADTAPLTERLQQAGVQVAAAAPDDSDGSSAELLAAAAGLAVRPGRCVVLTDSQSGVIAARSAGFALVIGVGCDGGDAVVADPGAVSVRTGDRPMSALPDAMTALNAGALRDLDHPAVFFDFDGTLSDIVDDPDAARPVAGAVEALTALAAQCPVAVLSGRDLADVRTRVGLDGIWYAGSHGFELIGPDGAHHQNDAAVDAVLVLAAAAGSLHEQLGAIPGIMVEHKRFAVAVHYRNVARDRVGEVLAAVRETGRRRGLRVTTGREVIELRPEIDWDKGRTLHWLLARMTGVKTPLFLGDDITDEDAFDAVAELSGAGIVVRHNDDGDRATAARYGLDSPAQAAEFTARLAERLAAG
ncbi:trehalose-phosphatase [Mycolicibacter virginiensis]|uniref:Trehalose 6-phosphate phosphatase n=1 Tax=Mycolicibacter virginiensis TaxID=1795032 RepID=A0A9X7NXR1_9MYCO|nr:MULTISPECIES: trehalose-phosphatase [Mycolicibacter]OBJ30900.1 trehalose-phosphatase [Mycolicibacter heraklionensis]PQM51278.1 trehalose-phosphatase [Mycolicibacter virginiensis]